MRLYNTDAAAIYNEISGLEGKKAGNLRGSYGYYFFGSTGYKQTVENFVEAGTDSSGYNNPIVTVKDALIVPEDYSAEHFVLSKGTFNVAGFGGDYGAHRAIRWFLSGHRILRIWQTPQTLLTTANLFLPL